MHQDPAGQPGHRIQQNVQKGYEIWSRRLSGHQSTCAFMVLNRAAKAQRVVLMFEHMPQDCFLGANEFRLRDAWARKDLGNYSKNGTVSVDLESHSCAVLVTSV